MKSLSFTSTKMRQRARSKESIPNFQALIMNEFNEQCVVANDQQFQQVAKALDRYYGATGLMDIDNPKKETEFQYMARKRRLQLERMMEKKQISFKAVVEKQSERNYRENIIRLKYSQDSNFNAVKKYIRKIIHSEDPFMVKKRKRFEDLLRLQMKRQ